MFSFNHATIMGNVTRDPEIRYTPKGDPICTFSLAINRRWTTDAGEKREETDFIDFKAFNRNAENIGEFVKKGDPLFVAGPLRLDQWEKDGVKHSKIVVHVDRFEFLKPKSNGGIPSTLREDS